MTEPFLVIYYSYTSKRIYWYYMNERTNIPHFYYKMSNYLAHAENLLRLHKINLWYDQMLRKKKTIFTLENVIELLF